MWTFSNITAGTRPQIQLVIDAEVFPVIYAKIQTDEYQVRKEAMWAVSNATSGGSPEQAMYLAQTGAIKALVTGLGETESRVAQVALEGLENMLRFGTRPPLNDGT
ncbi:KPNA1, partial [Symbiodinium microadriaticum]